MYDAKVWLKFVTSRSAARAAAIGLAGFAFVWAVLRAWVQALTGDEAQNYMFYGGRAIPAHWDWDPTAANHMLNSMGARLFTSLLGLSAFSVRIPTLIGAAIYIYTIYWLCETISHEWKIRIPLFVCLVYNPFIFDFFVAARGYGIGSAFLIAAIAVAAAWHLNYARPPGGRGGASRELMAATAISSAFLALAFTANFSMAFVGVTAMLAILVWAMKAEPTRRWQLLAAGVVPGLLVLLLIPSWALVHARTGGLSPA